MEGMCGGQWVEAIQVGMRVGQRTEGGQYRWT